MKSVKEHRTVTARQKSVLSLLEHEVALNRKTKQDVTEPPGIISYNIYPRETGKLYVAVTFSWRAIKPIGFWLCTLPVPFEKTAVTVERNDIKYPVPYLHCGS
ncbi:hypothetical protein CBL_01717 [Carabus blaptoides fortunei]